MDYLHTYIQLQSEERTIFTIDGIILPAKIEDSIQVDGEWFEITDTTFHCKHLSEPFDTSSKVVSETIWVTPLKFDKKEG